VGKVNFLALSFLVSFIYVFWLALFGVSMYSRDLDPKNFKNIIKEFNEIRNRRSSFLDF